jgi:hypothetical protein
VPSVSSLSLHYTHLWLNLADCTPTKLDNKDNSENPKANKDNGENPKQRMMAKIKKKIHVSQAFREKQMGEYIHLFMHALMYAYKHRTCHCL